MKKTANEQRRELSRNIRNVKFWFASFILLVLAAVLAVVCFLTNVLELYVVCGVVLLAFVIIYVLTTKAITHKDGYTLIQAMHFFRACQKAGIDNGRLTNEKKELICRIAVQFDYSSGLDQKQVLCLYQTGDTLATEIRRK